LAAALRARTAALHVQAERSGIVADILRGRASRAGYARLLRNLLPAYQAMEAGLDRHRLSPGLRWFARPEMYRAAAIAADLSALGGAPALLPAGAAYAARIAACDGPRLIGHAYARYLGDLSGGQVLKRLLARTLGLGAEGTSFYDFPEIADMDAFKRDFRAGLDRAGAEIGDVTPVLDEAAEAFRLNIAVSEAVQAAS
jgi:heme oxygenase